MLISLSGPTAPSLSLPHRQEVNRLGLIIKIRPRPPVWASAVIFVIQRTSRKRCVVYAVAVGLIVFPCRPNFWARAGKCSLQISVLHFEPVSRSVNTRCAPMITVLVTSRMSLLNSARLPHPSHAHFTGKNKRRAPTGVGCATIPGQSSSSTHRQEQQEQQPARTSPPPPHPPPPTATPQSAAGCNRFRPRSRWAPHSHSACRARAPKRSPPCRSPTCAPSTPHCPCAPQVSRTIIPCTKITVYLTLATARFSN